jgi:hypothetical protein
MLPAASDPRHGTLNGYRNLGCRCPRCTDANRSATADYKRRSRARDAAHREAAALRAAAEGVTRRMADTEELAAWLRDEADAIAPARKTATK